MDRILGLAIILSFSFTTQLSWAKHHQAFCSDLLALPLPVVAQSTDFTCGVACFDSVLRYSRGVSPGEVHLAHSLGTMLKGRTDSGAIVIAARAYGFFALERFGATLMDLRQYLLRGETVYVSWELQGVGHYSLVRGLGVEHITLMDPWFARTLDNITRSHSPSSFRFGIMELIGWATSSALALSHCIPKFYSWS